jgi:hypothetical protein
MAGNVTIYSTHMFKVTDEKPVVSFCTVDKMSDGGKFQIYVFLQCRLDPGGCRWRTPPVRYLQIIFEIDHEILKIGNNL